MLRLMILLAYLFFNSVHILLIIFMYFLFRFLFRESAAAKLEFSMCHRLGIARMRISPLLSNRTV